MTDRPAERPATPEHRLDGQVALVTGAGRGIGRAIALTLAREGADVAINDQVIGEDAQETCRLARAIGVRAECYEASVDDRPALAVMVEAVDRELGPIAILVHNAGIASQGRKVADTDTAEPGRLLAVHALGPFHLTQLVLPKMRTLPRGDIIFISSASTKLHAPGGAPYTMAKAAAEALARTLAVEERRHGIRTNIVGPGLTDTAMGRSFVAARGIDMADMDEKSPFGRVCTPEDIASVIGFLVSGRNGYVNGQTIYVDGGG